MRSLVISIYRYACETWTLTAELEKKIQGTEMRIKMLPRTFGHLPQRPCYELRSEEQYQACYWAVRKCKLR